MLETATTAVWKVYLKKLFQMMPKFNLHAGIFSSSLKLQFFVFFTAITLIINAMALYGNVFVASLIYRPPSLVPILTAL